MKYELTNKVIQIEGRVLHQIRALISFPQVKSGDLGGFVESTDNLSQEGNCWIFNNAKVYGDAKVYDDAQIRGEARVYGSAKVYGSAQIYGQAKVHGHTEVYDKARVFGCSTVYGLSKIRGSAEVYDEAMIQSCLLEDRAKAYGSAFLVDCQAGSDAKILGSTYAILSTFWGSTLVVDSFFLKSHLAGQAEVRGSTVSDSSIRGLAWVFGSLILDSKIREIDSIRASFLRFCNIRFFRAIRDSRVRYLDLATGGTLAGADVAGSPEVVVHSGCGRFGKDLTLYPGFPDTQGEALGDRVFEGFNLPIGLQDLPVDGRINYSELFVQYRDAPESEPDGKGPTKPLMINTGCFTGTKSRFYEASRQSHVDHPEVAEEYRTLIEMHQARLDRW